MRLKKEVVIRKMANKYILIATGELHEVYKDILKLNEDAGNIILLLQNDTTEEEMLKVLYEQYEANKQEKESIKKSVQSIISMLKENQLLED